MKTLIPTVLCVSMVALSQSDENLAPGEIYKRAAPAVVLIETYGQQGKVSGRGSGFLVSAEGKILTNWHVIAHTKQATVRLANDDAYDTVEVLEIDKRKDIALVKIKAVDLHYLRLGRSASVQVGDGVFSLSNPLGVFQNTLSTGIISGIRALDGYRMFQITAPISQGSSGSPIFDKRGDVIGIAASTITEAQNLSFAIPIDYARGMLATTQTQPLSAVYEPEETPSPTPSGDGHTGVQPAPSTTSVAVPEGMKNSSFNYLTGKIFTWTLEDAVRELGEPLRQRTIRNESNVPFTIHAFRDPTNFMREYELAINENTKKLTDIYAYPWNLSWEQGKKAWGDDYKMQKNPDNTRTYNYGKRRLNVRVATNGMIINIGAY